MRLVRLSLLAAVLGAFGFACGGADEPEDTTPATNDNPDLKVGAGGEVGVGEEGVKADVQGEVKAGDVGAKGGAGAGVDADKDGVKANAGGSVEGTTDADKDDDDQQKQQPLPSQD